MFNLSNSLSLLRAPLAFLFLIDNTSLRLTAIILAMITDSIDGYVARRNKAVSRFGAILDPAMDKFFVIFALSVFVTEGKLLVWQGLIMISRDFAHCLFGIYLSLSGHWQSYEFRAIRWGKITTALQFIFLVGIAIGYNFPTYLYLPFILFSALGLYELFQFKRYSSPPSRQA